MSSTNAPIPYSSSVDQPRPDEDETFDRIIAAMSGESDTTEKKAGHAIRTSHAKSTALLKGRLEVLPGLPAPLAQGLFARPGAYDVLVRFAQGPGEILSVTRCRWWTPDPCELNRRLNRSKPGISIFRPAARPFPATGLQFHFPNWATRLALP